MKKQDLKTGMILEFKNEEKAMVLLGTETGNIYVGETWGVLQSLNDNMEYNQTTYVTKIYQPRNNIDYLNRECEIEISRCELIWTKPSKVDSLRKRLIKKQEITEDMFEGLTSKEMMDLAKMLVADGFC